MKTWAILVLGGASLLMAGANARAALIIADFNDLPAAAIGGKAGGTGFTGNWTGSSGGTVVVNNLTSALYNVPQGGTPQHYKSVNATGLRQNYRTLTASPTGTVWFSFLAMAERDGDRAGLSFNSPTLTPFNDTGTAYAYLEGSTLNYRFGGTAATLASAATVGATALIVGKVTINPAAGAADPVELWINPDLMANSDITAYTPAYSNSSIDWLSSISHIGAIAARKDGGTSGSGNVDNIRISDGGGDSAQAFLDVTGIAVPEPASLLSLTALAGLGLLRRSRR